MWKQDSLFAIKNMDRAISTNLLHPSPLLGICWIGSVDTRIGYLNCVRINWNLVRRKHTFIYITVSIILANKRLFTNNCPPEEGFAEKLTFDWWLWVGAGPFPVLPTSKSPPCQERERPFRLEISLDPSSRKLATSFFPSINDTQWKTFVTTWGEASRDRSCPPLSRHTFTPGLEKLPVHKQFATDWQSFYPNCLIHEFIIR